MIFKAIARIQFAKMSNTGRRKRRTLCSQDPNKKPHNSSSETESGRHQSLYQ